jgi:hypothetical protein
MYDYELGALRRTTSAWIDSEGKVIRLSRPERVMDGVGGIYIANHTVRKNDRFIFSAADRQLPNRFTIDGIEITPEYLLFALWTADIRRGDWFWIDGVKYEVVFIHPERDYQTIAEIAYKG